MVGTQKPLHELKAGMNKFPQTMINVDGVDKRAIDDNATIQRAVSDAEVKLDGRGRVLLRPSGTEPVVRVMVEGENLQLVESLAGEIAAVVREAAR